MVLPDMLGRMGVCARLVNQKVFAVMAHQVRWKTGLALRVFLGRLGIFAMCMVWALGASGQTISDEELIDGFNRTVFGSEFSAFPFSFSYLRRFEKPVLFFVDGAASSRQSAAVERFVNALDRRIAHLRVAISDEVESANFIIHLVKRRDYADVVRNKVFKSRNAPVRGRCLVTASYDRSGIARSQAVIVVDEGDALFRRCMIEEILQGFGPLNDDESLGKSMFNDASPHTRLQTFDLLLLNMLYDRSLKSGMSQRAVQKRLPGAIARARRHVGGG